MWLGALKKGKGLGIRRLTEDDFLDFYDPSKIKFPISYQFISSITDYLLASKDLDKVEEELKAGESRQTPAIKTYLEREPVLFNLSWPFLGIPDTGTLFYAGYSANTMNVFDQFMVSRGLYFGKSGLKAKPESVEIFRPAEMATGEKKRPKAFDKKTRKGYSDHFPVEMVIEIL